MLLEHGTKNEGITHEAKHQQPRRISEVLSRWSNQRINDGRVLRLAYEVGKTDGNYRSKASDRSMAMLGCHAGYDGWRCHFCDL